MNRLATKHGDRIKKLTGIKSRLQFETINN